MQYTQFWLAHLGWVSTVSRMSDWVWLRYFLWPPNYRGHLEGWQTPEIPSLGKHFINWQDRDFRPPSKEHSEEGTFLYWLQRYFRGKILIPGWTILCIAKWSTLLLPHLLHRSWELYLVSIPRRSQKSRRGSQPRQGIWWFKGTGCFIVITENLGSWLRYIFLAVYYFDMHLLGLHCYWVLSTYYQFLLKWLKCFHNCPRKIKMLTEEF